MNFATVILKAYSLVFPKATPEIIRELEVLSLEVQSILNLKIEESNQPHGKIVLVEKNIEFFIYLFQSISSNCFNKIEVTKILKDYANKRIRNKNNSKDSYIPEFGFAFMDIFMLVILYKKYNLKKGKLLGILNQSMITGSGDVEISISYTILIFLQSSENIELQNLFTQLSNNNSQVRLPHLKGEPSCPFHLAKNKNQWINFIWDFMEKQVEPLFKY